jgi:hypothetical protein
MSSEAINKVAMLDTGELLLSLEGKGEPIYQYIYREAAGVYWDENHNGFKSTPLKERSCSEWFSQIISVVKSGLGVELQLSGQALWQNVPEKDKAEIIERYAI